MQCVSIVLALFCLVLIELCLVTTAYQHSHHTSSSTTTRETSQKLIHGNRFSHIVAQRKRSRNFLVSSALENIAVAIQNNVLLSDCITVSLSTAFSDLVAQNTEQGQKLLTGKRDKGISKLISPL